jgi:hypothetical protein
MKMNDLYGDGSYLKLDDRGYINWEELGVDNPYTVRGVDLGRDDHYGISIDNKTLKEIVEEAVKELLKEEKTETPKIEKYHMKHK